MYPHPHGASCQKTGEELSDKVKTLIATYLDLPRELVSEEARLSLDLGTDSLERIDLMIAFEVEFGVEINGRVVDGFATVGDIIKHLQRLTGAIK